MIGRVVSVKMQKTVVVLVESRKTHPLYKKSYVWSKRYLVDDPLGVALGDIVEIVKVRPISKLKHFQITKVMGKDFVALGEEHLKEKAEEAIAEVLPEEVEEAESVKGEGESKPEEVENDEKKVKNVRKKKGEEKARE